MVVATAPPRITVAEAEARERAAFAAVPGRGTLGALVSARRITIVSLYNGAGDADPWSNRDVWFLSFVWVPSGSPTPPPPEYVERAYAFVEDARGGRIYGEPAACLVTVLATEADLDRIPTAKPAPIATPR